MVRYIDIVFDVEADGPCPGLYSMVQLGAVAIADGKIFSSYMAYLAPMTTRHELEALKACNLTLEIVNTYPAPSIGIAGFHAWLLTLKPDGDEKLQGWSDNPAFDWQFINYYLHNYGHDNPLGHSCRRIGDLSAGLIGQVRNHSSWKNLKDTKHTHVAIDDARGNGEALIKILAKQL